jgi:signal transduction histidine kinase
MSRRFNEMADALAVRRQLQVAFLGGVAHDLRNPLAVLKLSLALVPPDQPLPPERRLRQMMEKIARQITRLDRMAGDFLDMAKIEAGELELKLGEHDACELVRHVTALFADTPAERRLRTTLPRIAVQLMCDPLRMEQVLTNLISNAMKYSPEESVVDLSLEEQASAVVFTVVDHGVGIPENEQQRVFEPFRRAGMSKETVPGVGLGLFVVRRIVEAHGGRIELSSAEGVGSTFRVHVPVVREHSTRSAPRQGQSLAHAPAGP